METVIHVTSFDSPAFQNAVHGVLRTLIDKLDVKTFNVGILGMNAVNGDLAADFTDGNSKASSGSSTESAYGVTARYILQSAHSPVGKFCSSGRSACMLP